MARVALVTGGTRGIGAAISTALKEAGYTVAANYGGNDEAAKCCQHTHVDEQHEVDALGIDAGKLRSLQVAASGLVTTGDGRPVLGEGGPLTLPPFDSISIVFLTV